MARSPTGTFTLVAGNPVITGTIITSDWANTTMPDIGAALTDSLSRTGQGGMLAPIRGVSGSATAPAHSFTDFPRSGMYAVGANEMRYAVNGVDRMRWQAGGLPTQTYNVATGLWEDLEAVGVVGPNLLYNSNFQIAQRGAGPISLAAVGTYGLDRWASAQSNTTHRQSSNGASRYLVVERGGTFSQILAGQPIRFDERSRTPFTVGGTFTLSWEMFCDVPTGAGCRVSFAKNWVASNFETIYSKAGIQDVPAGVWTRVTQTFTLASDVVDTAMDRVLVEVGVWDASFPVPANEPVRIRNVKLEEGNTFTGYEPMPYAVDEAECMKWLYIMDGGSAMFSFASNNTARRGTVYHPKMYFDPDVSDVTVSSGTAALLPSYSGTAHTTIEAEMGNTTSLVRLESLTVSCEL